MRLSLAFAALICTTPFVSSAQETRPDEFSLEVLSANEARIDYWNSEDRQSGYAPRELTSEGITVGLHIDITMGPETLTVTPPAGWVALPTNSITVADGEMGSIYIVRDLEHLGM